MQFEEDSSIDGELAGFLSKYDLPNNIPKPAEGEQQPGAEAESEPNLNEVSDIFVDQASEYHEAAENVLMPACLKLNKVLTNHGYRVNPIQGEHIDVETRAVSIFVVDSWADSLHIAMTEMLERQRQSHDALLDTSAASHKEQLSAEVLMSRISDMQDKLYEAERKVKSLENDNKTAEEQVLDIAKKYKSLQSDSKLQFKHLEQKNQEHERRARQKETEMQKLREKLFNIANADRQNATSKQHKSSLSALRQGEIINSVGTKQMKKISSTTSSPNTSFSASSTVSGSSKKTQDKSASLKSPTSGPVYMTQVIEAMEAKNNNLEKENEDLHKQVQELSAEVKSFMNKDVGSKARGGGGKKSVGQGFCARARKGFSDSMAEDDDDDGTGDEREPTREDIGEDSWYPATADSSMNSDRSDISSNNGRGTEPVNAKSGKALLWETVQEFKQNNKQLQHRLELAGVASSESEQTIELMRSRAQELREELENVRLELDSRPHVKQYNALQRSHKELEEKLHDVIMMRKEAQELNAWRKHLSTAERIKIDKRNHELGLWLVDSLPKAVIKDVLQAACRELNINDISELQPTLVKLKTVIKAVPRMERFITGVCGYVFERQLPILPPSRTSTNSQGKGSAPATKTAAASTPNPEMVMEDVLPVLKSWWNSVSYLDELKSFEDVLLRELHRREHVLGQAQCDVEPGSKPTGMTRMDTQQQTYLDLGASGKVSAPVGSTPEETWEIYGKVQWSRRDRSKVIEIIRELIDFQLEVFNYKKSLLAAEEYVQGNPESLICRLISHLKYLFGISS